MRIDEVSTATTLFTRKMEPSFIANLCEASKRRAACSSLAREILSAKDCAWINQLSWPRLLFAMYQLKDRPGDRSSNTWYRVRYRIGGCGRPGCLHSGGAVGLPMAASVRGRSKRAVKPTARKAYDGCMKVAMRVRSGHKSRQNGYVALARMVLYSATHPMELACWLAETANMVPQASESSVSSGWEGRKKLATFSI